MKTFCRDLSERTMEIIDCQKIEMILLTKKEKNHISNKKYATYAKMYLMLKMAKIIKTFEIIVIIQANAAVLHNVFAT